MGSTVSTVIRIRNLTESDVTSIFVYDANSLDFRLSRPDKVFKGTSIAAGGCLERTIACSTLTATWAFTTKMQFRDGSEDVFAMNYKWIYNDTDPGFRHSTRSHLILYKKTGPRVLEISVANTPGQLENRRAEELMATACKLLEFGRPGEAAVKFEEALRVANKKETVLAIENHRRRVRRIKEIADADRRAKTLNNEGLQFLRDVKFVDALKRFDEALHLAQNSETIDLIEDNLRIAKDAKSNQDANKLYREGVALQKDTRAAVRKLDEALKIALDCNLTNSIKTRKAEILAQEGREILEEARFLAITSPEEAIYKFSKARLAFQQAASTRPDVKFEKLIGIVDCQTEGDKQLNAGLQLEIEGSRLIDKTLETQSSGDCREAREKYEEARKRYQEAAKLFEEGRKKGEDNFDRSLELTSEALRGIERILSELEKAQIEIDSNDHN